MNQTELGDDLQVALNGVLSFREMYDALAPLAAALDASAVGLLRLPRPALGALAEQVQEQAKGGVWSGLADADFVRLNAQLIAMSVSAVSYPTRGFAALLLSRDAGFSLADEQSLLALRPLFVQAYVRCSRFESLLGENQGLTALIEHRLGACAALASAGGTLLWCSESAREVLGSEGEALLAERVREAITGSSRENVQQISLHMNKRHVVYGSLSFVRDDPAASVQYVAIELHGTDVESGADGYNLTAAERETYDLLLKGQSYNEIARTRHVSIDTVRSQVKAIFRKADVTSRMELVTKRMTGLSK